MNTNIRLKIFSFFVLLILTLSMLVPSTVLADDTTPPPQETQETVPPTEETEEPAPPVEETQDAVSPQEELPTEEETTEAVVTETSTEEATPDPTDEVVGDESGLPEEGETVDGALTEAPTEEATPGPTDGAVEDGSVLPEDGVLTEAPTEEVTPEPTDEAVGDESVLPEDGKTANGALTEAPTEDVNANPTDETVMEEPTSEEDAPAENVSSVLEQLPEGTDLVVLDQDGQAEPLATVKAADALAGGDPYFTVGGTTYHFFQNAGDCALNGYGGGLGTTCFESPTPIQDAIDNVNAGGVLPDDSKIYVGPGTYAEQIVISTNGLTLFGDPGILDLPGAGPDAPVLDGATLSGYTTGVTINAEGVSLIGFVIQNYDLAIYQPVVSGSNTVTIENNTIQDNGDGISINKGTGSPGTAIHYNVFQNNSGNDLINNDGSNNQQFIEAQNNYWGCASGPVVAYKKYGTGNQKDVFLGWAYIDWQTKHDYGLQGDNDDPDPNCALLYGFDAKYDFQINSPDYSPYKINISNLAVPGCEDPDANNYGQPGVCSYDIPGCTNPEATNYDPNATVDDGSCVYPPVLGCTDPEATNYDPNATVDDGSCLYPPILGCTDPEATNYDPNATVDDGSCVYPPILGCTDPEATNYDPNATVDDGSCLYSPILGCTDPEATNYDPNATVDDGSCLYPPILGCTDPEATNYNPNATVDDGTCLYPPVLGCTDQEATNYNPNATVDDGSCLYSPILGCTDPEATNYNPNATVDNSSCLYPPILGCTDSKATNYNPNATVDNGSCLYPPVLGCTDPKATNYNPSAVLDNGSCQFLLISTPQPSTILGGFIPVTGGETHAIAAGIAHTCALTPQGGVQCWGNNDYGQLGNGTYTGSNIRVDVTGLLGGTTIVAGGNHTCLLSSGDVWCWGQNTKGQIGDGTTMNHNVPVKVLSGAANITAGFNYTCATMLSGQVMCWGNNDKGQLGDGGQTNRTIPTLATLISNVSNLDAGQNETCGLTETGLVRCLANGSSQDVDNLPETNLDVAVNRFGPKIIALNRQGVPVEFLSGEAKLVSQLSSILDVDSGLSHICALKETGGVYCWGSNYYGQLGNNSTTRSSDPVPVTNLSNAWQLAVGEYHACVMVTPNNPNDAGIWCWGLNADGQLGDGTYRTSLVPVEVK